MNKFSGLAALIAAAVVPALAQESGNTKAQADSHLVSTSEKSSIILYDENGNPVQVILSNEEQSNETSGLKSVQGKPIRIRPNDCIGGGCEGNIRDINSNW